jgi:diguanylate cyclase (GGDEF)-like protein
MGRTPTRRGPFSHHDSEISGLPLDRSDAAFGLRNQELVRLLQSVPAIIWTTDENLRITSIWGSSLPDLNPMPHELTGTTLFDYFGTSGFTATLLHALKGKSVNYDADYKGRLFSIRVEPLRNDESRIIGTVGVAVDTPDRRESDQRIRYLATHDALTDLSSYGTFLEAFDNELQRSDRTGRQFAVVLLDLDHLKEINDHYGHLAGSRALCRLATILKRTCRTVDTAARYGGDEFAALLVEADEAIASCVAHRIKTKLAEDGGHPSLTVSVGMALYPRDGYTTENLLAAADRALYRNKLRKSLHTKIDAASVSDRDSRAGGKRPERRRSERLSLDVTVVVRGESIEKQSFQEETFTISASAHGALVLLAKKLALGQRLFLKNPKTQDEIEGRIARLGPPHGGLAQVGIDFLRPAPEFWPVNSLPESWMSLRQ